MFTFYVENHEHFGSLTKNCPKLDKNKSTVSRFSVFVVYRSAVSTVQKSNYVGLLKFLETRTLLIQQKITEKVSLYTNNT